METAALTRFPFHPAHAGGAFLLPCILTRCRAFILPGCNTAPHKHLQRVLPYRCNYTAHSTKQRTGIYRGFSGYLAHTTAHDTRPTQAGIMPPTPRLIVCQRPDALHLYQIPAPRPDAAQASTAAYYNKVYKSAAYRRPYKPGGVSMLPTSGGWRSGTGSAVRAGILAPSTRRGSPTAGARRAARNHWRLPPYLFLGFRPIANKGEQ